MATKLSVTHNGKAFYRTTDHAYTHVVFARRCKEEALSKAGDDRKGAYVHSNYAYAAREGFFRGTFQEYLEWLKERAIARIEKSETEGYYEIQPASWHHDQRAAVKGAQKAAKWAIEVIIVPVDPAN